MFRWLERLLVMGDDQLPTNANVVIGIGIDVTKDGFSASPYSRAVAQKCLALYRSGQADNILLVGGYMHNFGCTEAQAMSNCISHLVKEDNLFLETESF